MLSKQESQIVELGALLQEAIDRLSTEQETLDNLPVGLWLEQIKSINLKWRSFIRDYDLMPKPPDKDKEDFETLSTHALTWLNIKEEKPLPIISSLEKKCGQIQELITLLNAQSIAADGMEILDNCQILFTQISADLAAMED